KGTTYPATKWFLDVATAQRRPPRQDSEDLDRKVFSIRDPEILDVLGLPTRPDHRYTVNEFLGKFKPLLTKFNEFKDKDPKDLSASEKQVSDFFDSFGQELVEKLQDAFILFNLNQKVFRIENDEVLDALHVQARFGLRYSVSELMENLEEFFH